MNSLFISLSNHSGQGSEWILNSLILKGAYLEELKTYALGEASPAVDGALLNRAGDGMVKLPVTLTAAGADFYELSLPLANLAPGEYLVELTASIGSEPVRQLIAFRVTS